MCYPCKYYFKMETLTIVIVRDVRFLPCQNLNKTGIHLQKIKPEINDFAHMP